MFPRWKPSPSAERMTIEITPQMIPNMVRKLRTLFAFRFSQTCDRMITISSLQDNFLAFGQALDDFGASSIAESHLDGFPAAACRSAGLRHFDPCGPPGIV